MFITHFLMLWGLASPPPSPEALGIEWVSVPGGQVTLGDELLEPPEVHVEVKPFEISRAEITVGQFKACVQSGWCDVGRSSEATGLYAFIAYLRDERLKSKNLYVYRNHIHFSSKQIYREDDALLSDRCNLKRLDSDSYPINCISYTSASMFASWINARLPTEAEWLAALQYRYPDRGHWRRFSCAEVNMDDEETVGPHGAQVPGCGYDRPGPVCSRPADRAGGGLPCDLLGNVWEWTTTLYSLGDKAPSYASGFNFTLRGGGWLERHADFLPTERLALPMFARQSDVGFRVVKLEPQERTP